MEKLGISLEINSSGMAKGISDLDKLGKAGDKAETSLNKIPQTFDEISAAVNIAKAAIAGFAAGELVKIADGYKSMQGQLALVTRSTDELVSVQAKLNKVANDTFQNQSAVVSLYGRLQPSLEAIGKSSNDTVKFIETFNKALALTSPSAMESEAAIRQFAQAMGTGALRGDEFTSIMENANGVAQTLAKGLGVSIGALREMAAEGQLTADVVFNALSNQAAEVDAQFSKLPTTVGDATTVMNNAIMNYVGNLDSATGATTKLANGILYVGRNIETVATVSVVALAAAMATRLVPAAYAAATAMAATATSATAASTALRAATASALAFAATPIGAAALAAAGAFAYLTMRTNETEKAIDELRAKNGVLDDAQLKANAERLVELRKELQGLMSLKAGGAYDVLGKKEKALRAEIDALMNAKTQTQLLNEQTSSLGMTYDSVEALIKSYSTATNSANSASEKGQEIIGQLQEKYALLTLSARDAAIAQARFAALNKGATAEEIAFIEQTAAAIFDKETATKQAAKAAKEYTKATKEQSKAHLEARDAIEKQMTAISAAQVAMRKFTNGSDFERMNSDIEELNQSWKVLYDEGLISAQEYADALYQIDSDRLGFSKETNRKIADDTSKTVDWTVEAMKNSLKRLDDAFANVWEDIFNGASDFGSSLKRWFTSLLAELAHAAITKPIVISMSGALGIGGSSSAMASGTNVLSSAGNVASIYSLGAMSGAISQGASYGLGALGAGSFGAANSTISSMVGTGNYAGALGTAAGTYLPVIGGAMYGYQQAGAGGAVTGAGGAYLGAQIGTMVLPGIGTAVGAFLGSLGGGELGKALFGGDWEYKRLDTTLSASGSALDLSMIKTERKDPGAFKKTKTRRTDVTDLTIEEAFATAYSGLYDEVAGLAERLGFTVAEDFTASVSANLKGKSEAEITQWFNDAFTQIGDQLVASAGGLSEALEPLKQGSETSYQALSRLTGQFDAFNYPIGRLNDSLITLNISTLTAVDALSNMAGGMQNLAAMQSSFINAFYSDAQKAELTAETVGNIFDSIGMKAPESRSALVALVESLDLTTEAGRNAYVSITSASATLDAFYANIETGAREASEAAEEMARQAAEAAEYINQKINENISSAMNALSRAVEREKDILTKSYNDRLEALNSEKDSIAKTVTAISALRSALKSTYDTIYKTIVNPMVSYTRSQVRLLEIARTGVLPTQDELTDILDGATRNDQKYYASFEDYARDQAITGNAISEIMLLTDDQLSTADKQLMTLENQLATAKAQYEQDIKSLDETLAYWQKQIDALNGVNDSVLSVRDAVNALQAALNATKVVSSGYSGFASDEDYLKAKLEQLQATGETQYTNIDQVAGAFNYAGLTPAEHYAKYGASEGVGTIYSGANAISSATQSSEDAYFAQKLAELQSKGKTEYTNIDQVKGAFALAGLTAQQHYELYGKNEGLLPSFSVGTNYVPHDMEAKIHKGEMIVPAKYNPMTSGIGGDAAMLAELQALRAEIAELKAQDRQIGVQLIKSTNKTADYFEQWDATGLKVEVMA